MLYITLLPDFPMTLPATSLLIIISCVTSGALIVPVNLSLKQSKYNIIFREKYLFSLTKIFVVICVTSARWRRRP